MLCSKALFGQGIPIEAVHVWCNSDQQPNPESRVLLGSAKHGHLGMPEVVVDWQLVAEDKISPVSNARLPRADSRKFFRREEEGLLLLQLHA